MLKQASDLTTCITPIVLMEADLMVGSQDIDETRVKRRRTVDWRMFQRLDFMRQPGLTEIQFRALFSKCGVCGLITTRQVFSFHECQLKEDPTDVEDAEDDQVSG
jgi:hypothetical protein